jgi:hypothetical protein
MQLIRKLSVGVDYKNSMHYTVGQEVYGGHYIVDIVEEEDRFVIFIQKQEEVKEWKFFLKTVAVSGENNIHFD